MRLRGQHQSTIDSRQEPAATGAQAASAPGQLSLLTEAARVIGADLPQDELLQRMSDIVRQVVGAHQAVISLTIGDDAAQSVAWCST